jgi:hypothetical protein
VHRATPDGAQQLRSPGVVADDVGVVRPGDAQDDRVAVVGTGMNQPPDAQLGQQPVRPKRPRHLELGIALQLGADRLDDLVVIGEGQGDCHPWAGRGCVGRKVIHGDVADLQVRRGIP